MRRPIHSLFLVLALMLFSGTWVMAQQHGGHHPMANSQSQAVPEATGESCPHLAGMSAAMEKLERAITAGRESNDPAKMKLALDEAAVQLTEMKKHRSMCPMMSGKHDMAGTDQCPMMSGKHDMAGTDHDHGAQKQEAQPPK